MKKLILFSIIGLAFTACKVGPGYNGRDFELAEGFSVHDSLAFATDSVNTDSLEFAVQDIEWWKFFNDPVLDSLIREGLSNNQDLLITAKQIEIAQFQLGIQKAAGLPSFGINGSGNYGTASIWGIQNGEATSTVFGTANLNWEIDFWGKFRRLNESARAQLMATEFGYRSLALSLIETISQTYFQYLATQSQLEISKRNASSRDSMLLIIGARFREGIVPEIDLNQAQIQHAIAAAAVPAFERRLVQTRNLLNFLVGRVPGAIVTTNVLQDEELLVEIPVQFPVDLLARRPDIRAAEQELIAQNALIGAAQANRLPAISVSALLGVGYLSTGLLSPSDPIWQASGGLLLPLFNWGALKKQVEVERGRTMQSELNYRQTVLNALKEVEDALIEVSTLKEEIEINKTRATAALNAEYLSRERYDKGVTSYLEFLESQRQAFDAELALVENQSKLLSAYIKLYGALGGGWLSEEEKKAAEEAAAEEAEKQ